MSNIEEFEQNLIQLGMNDEAFEEYKTLLKRVRGNELKRQHCYTTAIQFPPERAEEAVRLINYGIDAFPDDWFSTYTSYLFIGRIWTACGNYHKAHAAFLLAMDALGHGRENYKAELSGELLWTRLHLDAFQYSEELEAYYASCSKASTFSKALVNNAYRMAIAKLVISLHYNQGNEAKLAYAQATQISNPTYTGELQRVFSKHHYCDTLKTTPESVHFLTKIKNNS